MLNVPVRSTEHRITKLDSVDIIRAHRQHCAFDVCCEVLKASS
jgi:hypothetical protein